MFQRGISKAFHMKQNLKSNQGSQITAEINTSLYPADFNSPNLRWEQTGHEGPLQLSLPSSLHMLQLLIKIWQIENILTGAAGRMELTSELISEVFHRKLSDFFLFFGGFLLLLTTAVMQKTLTPKPHNGKISSSLIPALHILLISLTAICYLLNPAKY